LQFWGELTGTDEEINIAADKVAGKILRECVWIDLRQASPRNDIEEPRSRFIIDCRQSKGFGIRWSMDGEFKSFLEPIDHSRITS